MIAREAAQARADRIRAFREELTAAEREGAVVLSSDQKAAIGRYHDGLLEQFARSYDVDRSDAQHQLSLGMRVVSLLGAAALTGAVVLFFLDVWGALPSAAQIAIAWTAPLAALLATSYAAQVERTRYFTAILSFLALGCFMLNVAVLGAVFNRAPSPTAILVCGLFALILAYRWDLGWMLAAGAVGVIAYFATTFISLIGFPLDISLERPEVIVVPSLAVYASALLPVNTSRVGFPAIVRRIGLIALFLAVIALGEQGSLSFLPFAPGTVEVLYQVAGFALAGAAIWLGVRNGWGDSLNIGAVAASILLLLRYVDWWWEWMPTSLFFLIVAGTSIVALVALRRLRHRMGETA